MGWAKSITGGIILGALISVVPLDFMMCVLPPPIAFALLVREKEQRHRRKFVRRLALSVAIASSIGAVASQLPFKHLDGRVTLPSACVTVASAAKAADWDVTEASPEGLERIVCTASSEPTLRELRSALEATGFELFQGYCGNGATLLWGGSPMIGILKMKR